MLPPDSNSFRDYFPDAKNETKSDFMERQKRGIALFFTFNGRLLALCESGR